MTSINWDMFCEDHGLEYKSKNSRDFTQINCMYCGDNGFKGGLNSGNWYVCWKCGSHSINEVIMILTGENWHTLHIKYLDQYDARSLYLLEHSQLRERSPKIEFKERLTPLNDRAKKYLTGRGFDPYFIEEKYKIKSTTENGSHCHRLYIPVIMENKEVSWTTRDITNRAPQRYLSCPEKDEVRNHKKILYNIDNCNNDHIILVEGVTDCWKLGDNSASCFGIKYCQEQVLLLASFEKVTILFDPEENAQKQADALANQLAGLGVDCSCVYLKGDKDPGDLSCEEAENLKKQILGD